MSPVPLGRRIPKTRVPTLRFEASEDTGRHVAHVIARLIRQRNQAEKPTVLGLATGSTPIGVYRELIRLHRQEGLDFARVITFNLDEYWPMPEDSIHSYRRWMQENFFDHVNVVQASIHIPRGDISRKAVDAFCADYEQAIEEAGGIDIQLLGVGRTGHIGFNEPGSSRDSRTRLITLDPVTRKDAASGFYGEENVPLRAITMGVGTILTARQVICMALGEHKAAVVRQAVEERPTDRIVASFLQSHQDAQFVLDAAAAADLTAVRTPWTVETVEWSAVLERQAVIWLAQQAGKPILKLEARDFHEHHLADLVYERGPVQEVRQRVFDGLMNTLCPQPGRLDSAVRAGSEVAIASAHGNGGSLSLSSQSVGYRTGTGSGGADTGGTRPPLSEGPHGLRPNSRAFAGLESGAAKPDALRVIVFSPHPDDDVISMGGTLITLADQGHDVHVAYMTSGNIAVFDHDALRHIDYVSEYLEMFGLQTAHSLSLEGHLRNAIARRQGGELDDPDILKIKALIRQTEAVQAALTAGVPAEKCHFLNLPFYRTGQVRKNPIGQEDVDIITRLMTDLSPGQIYVAGDLSDPHGTHRMCAEAILRAVDTVGAAGVIPEVWLYRGAWQEYAPHEIDRAVPLNPETMLRKKLAIFKHESQKDAALFPGHDEREFWVRAEERTKETARIYNALGLPEFHALESFKRYDGMLG
ncbi:MAG: glucosamine-6-phosphate deaminase [Planctomycetaceae bacterium]